MQMFKIEQVHIALSRKDGGVSIMALLTVGRGSVLPLGAQWLEDGWWVRSPSDDVVRNEVRAMPEADQVIGWKRIEAADVPSGRTYRDAWTLNSGRIEHDMTKARDVHRARIRKARTEALKQLDGEWMRAVGQGQQIVADEIEKRRQLWRDAPADPQIDAAKTIEDLKGIA